MNPLFQKDLHKGDWGVDVIRLQNFLEKNGYADFVPTGFFGDKTKNALVQFQLDNKIIPASGFLGPITRDRINKNYFSDSREKLYVFALSQLGIDITPDDIVPDEYDCADTICAILKNFGQDIGNFPSTLDLYGKLKINSAFREVWEPLRGDIIISPTGYRNGSGTENIPNGHVGIVGEGGIIMSNSSATGKFETNFTLAKWMARYVVKGGYPVFYFRLIR